MLIELWKLSRLETGPNLAKFNNSKRIKLKAKIGKGNNEGASSYNMAFKPYASDNFKFLFYLCESIRLKYQSLVTSWVVNQGWIWTSDGINAGVGHT